MQAKTWRVNNNAAMNPNFTSFAEAQSAVGANDTLYFEGSTVSYGNILLTKPLVLFGTGYFLEENPQTQSNSITAKFGTVGFNAGSSGSSINGFELLGNTTISTSNISVTHCYTKNIQFNSSSTTIGNILLLGNYVNPTTYGNYGVSLAGTNPVFNVIISNCFITGNSVSAISLSDIASGQILNNTIQSDIRVYNFKISNNIQRSGSVTLNNNLFYNNISYGTEFPAGNGNQQNINMTDVFVGSTGNSTDGQWQLKPYSSAKGAGNDGTDCGMFGGSSPYVLSGLPTIPAIYEIIMPSTGDNINGIDVTIKAKTH